MTNKRKLKRVVIKEELVALTGDFTKAVILNQFIYWSERVEDFDEFIVEEKARMEKETKELNIEKQNGWIYKTAEEMAKETMLGLSPKTMRNHIKYLVDNHWLDERNNPKYKWDRTLQYRVNIKQIQIDLFQLGYVLDGYPLQFNSMEMANLCKGQKGKMDKPKKKNHKSEKENAIPEITTEITTEITSLEGYKGSTNVQRYDFSFDVLDIQIEKIMNTISNNGIMGNLDTNDIKEFFRMYYNYGGYMRNIKPTKLKNEQIENIITSISYISKADYNPSLDDYKKILIDYFNQDFPDCDYGINHFISGDVLLMRYYNLRPLLE